VQILGAALRTVANLRPGDGMQIGNVTLTFSDVATLRSRITA
jgi:hypothetical protein